MSVLIDVSVSASDFLFRDVLTNHPTCTVQLEPSVSTGNPIVSYVWTTKMPPDRLEGLFSSEPGVERAEIVDTTDERLLVRLTWDGDGDVNALLTTFRELPVTVWEAIGSGEGWYFTLRFLTADAVSRFYRECRNDDIAVNPLRIQQNAPRMAGGKSKYGLTPLQRKTLVQAHESGYFKIPRETTLTKLAERYAVSDNALSERLRRGIDALVGNTLVDSKESVWFGEQSERRIENN